MSDTPQSAEIANALQQAMALHQQGQLAQAGGLYRAILERVPDHFDAMHLLGVIAFQQKQGDAAVRLIGRALALNPNAAAAHSNLGMALLELKRPDEALASFDRALALAPHYAEALNDRGIALRGLARHAEALDSYDRALAIRPDYADALNNRGNALRSLDRPEAALVSYDRALLLRPGYVEALTSRGDTLCDLLRPEAALESYARALAIKPDDAEILDKGGTALFALKRYDEALAAYHRAVAIRPDHAEAISNRGLALLLLRRHGEALASFERALVLAPDHADALNGRGATQLELGRRDEALASFDRALAIKPDDVAALDNRGNALRDLKRHDEAAEAFERLLKARPDFDYLRGKILAARNHCCDWRDYARNVELVTADVVAGRRAITPFAFLAISDSPADQLKCAEIFSHDKYAAAAPLWRGQTYRHDRIRVAYLSADFHEHAVAYLVAELFESHDRSRFQTTGLSFGPHRPSDLRNRLEGAFDQFIDVQGKSDLDIALLLTTLEIDIAVDLTGLTGAGRPGVLAFRPAPVQVNFLGFPGTMGADHIDYILADRFVIPEAQKAFYRERVIYLPDSYQPNDSKRRISERTPTRAEAGLPEAGFVFCSFNNSYKITPPAFDVWMRLLGRVEGSLLWLLGDTPAAKDNLRRNAESRRIAPERLVFAPRVKLEDHLARHRLAGFLLDTMPYTAHTTASDALWAGLPVVTCLGSSFAARVAGSLLHAVGLPELVTETLEDYEAVALKLALDPALLAATKAKLARNRDSFPLFDTGRFRRHIESAYETMWQRQQRGEPPASFAVEPCRG